MSPSDAVVALRSLPRRFRAVVVRGDDEDSDRPEHVVHRAGASGLSAMDHVATATALIAGRDPGCAASPGAVGGRTASEVVTDLAAAAEGYADEVARVSPDTWTTDALERVAAIVTAAVEHLRAAERSVDEARRTR